MKRAEEWLELRNKKETEWLEFDKKVKGQWQLIESNVDKFNLGRNSKYIDIVNVGELYKENERKLIDLGYKILVTKNGTRLYFDNQGYSDYLKSNMDSDKKMDLKNNLNNKVEDKKKDESIKTFATYDDFLRFITNSL